MPDALSAEHDKLTKTNDSTAIKYSSVLQHNRTKPNIGQVLARDGLSANDPDAPLDRGSLALGGWFTGGSKCCNFPSKGDIGASE